MTYITVRQSPAYHQISLEEFLFSNDVGGLVTYNKSNNGMQYFSRLYRIQHT